MAKFKVPVEWAVYDFVEVEADDFKSAVKYVVDNKDEIPLGTEPEYIDGTYKISGEDEIIGCHNEDEKYVEDLTNLLYSFGYGE